MIWLSTYILFLKGIPGGESSILCPLSHPFAYLNGDYCCKTAEERPTSWGWTPQDEIDDGTCDGVDFNLQSVCCKTGYTPCPQGSGCTSLVN